MAHLKKILFRLIEFRDMHVHSCLEYQIIIFNCACFKVNLNCWQQAPEIKDHLLKLNMTGTEEELLDLWGTFQSRAFNLAVEANNKQVLTWSHLAVGNEQPYQPHCTSLKKWCTHS